jgi:S-adenosylmethionine synthetase
MGKFYRAKGSKDKRRIVMIEKVNPCHPDKVADRIAGAIVDIAYKYDENPKIAVEVLIGHGKCFIITESNCDKVSFEEVENAVHRIAGDKIDVEIIGRRQDEHLAENQEKEIRCGDNGIFKGVPLTENEKEISRIAHAIYSRQPSDGKYILTDNKFICCQSNAKENHLRAFLEEELPDKNLIINPLGEWKGGINVDTGATNRKLGSDMGQSVTGGGLHGKDLSKADVSINIYAFLKAQETGKPVELCCAIGDTEIDGVPYKEIVEIARQFIKEQGGFEKFAEWGLY